MTYVLTEKKGLVALIRTKDEKIGKQIREKSFYGFLKIVFFI